MKTLLRLYFPELHCLESANPASIPLPPSSLTPCPAGGPGPKRPVRANCSISRNFVNQLLNIGIIKNKIRYRLTINYIKIKALTSQHSSLPNILLPCTRMSALEFIYSYRLCTVEISCHAVPPAAHLFSAPHSVTSCWQHGTPMLGVVRPREQANAVNQDWFIVL